MKNTNWAAILLLIAAIPVVNFVAAQLSVRGDPREAVPTQLPAPSQIRIVVSSQDAEGITQEQMNLDFLKNLETYTVERVKVKAREYLASVGQTNAIIDIASEATYVEAGPVKLAIVRLKDAGSRQVFIAGIVGKELKRVACIRESVEAIPVSYGLCGDKIRDVFGAKIGG